MDANEMQHYICQACDGTTVTESSGDVFFIYDPEGDLPANRQFPFATIVTNDNYETVSGLNRVGVYRLNLGLTKATYISLFGTPPTERDEHGVLATGFDYAALDQVMPHPVYAGQYWVCVVTPSDTTMDTLRPLLAEAHKFAKRKHTNQRRRTRS